MKELLRQWQEQHWVHQLLRNDYQQKSKLRTNQHQHVGQLCLGKVEHLQKRTSFIQLISELLRKFQEVFADSPIPPFNQASLEQVHQHEMNHATYLKTFVDSYYDCNFMNLSESSMTASKIGAFYDAKVTYLTHLFKQCLLSYELIEVCLRDPRIVGFICHHLINQTNCQYFHDLPQWCQP